MRLAKLFTAVFVSTILCFPLARQGTSEEQPASTAQVATSDLQMWQDYIDATRPGVGSERELKRWADKYNVKIIGRSQIGAHKSRLQMETHQTLVKQETAISEAQHCPGACGPGFTNTYTHNSAGSVLTVTTTCRVSYCNRYCSGQPPTCNVSCGYTYKGTAVGSY
jgi:hypothetical protein